MVTTSWCMSDYCSVEFGVWDHEGPQSCAPNSASQSYAPWVPYHSSLNFRNNICESNNVENCIYRSDTLLYFIVSWAVPCYSSCYTCTRYQRSTGPPSSSEVTACFGAFSPYVCVANSLAILKPVLEARIGSSRTPSAWTGWNLVYPFVIFRLVSYPAQTLFFRSWGLISFGKHNDNHSSTIIARLIFKLLIVNVEDRFFEGSFIFFTASCFGGVTDHGFSS